MRSIGSAFALGIFVLQQQAVLPGRTAWVGLVFGFALLLWGGQRLRRRDGSARMHRCVGWAAFAAAAGLAGFGYAALRAESRLSESLVPEWEGRDIVVTGAVRGLPSYDATGVRFLFDVDTNDAGMAKFPSTIRLAWITRERNVERPVLRPGERWRLTVRVKRPHGNANFHLRDPEAGWLARKIRALGYVTSPHDARRLDGSAPGGRATVDRVRAGVRDRIDAALADAGHRGIVIALAIGAQDGIADSDWRTLRNTGTSHLVAISGLHVGIVGGLCGWLVAGVWRRSGWVGRNWPLTVPAQQVAMVGAVAGAAAYAALAGWSVPVQRAWWMLAAAGAAYLSGRRVATSAVLAWALGCVVLLDPWAVVSPGFWLSFGAVAAILLAVSGRFAARRPAADRDDAWPDPARRWRGAFEHRVRRFGARLREAARVQYAVTIALAPLTVVWFSQIPLAGPLANAFAIPWVGSLVAPVVLAGVVLPAPLDAAAYRLAHALVAGMMLLLDKIAAAPHAVRWLPEPSPFVLAVAVLGAIWALLPRGWPLRWAAPLAWLPLLAPGAHGPAHGGFRLTALDVGQGSAVLIETATHTVLFDTGPGSESTHAGERIVVPFLRARGVTALDALIVSHEDADHAGGTAAVLAAIPVRQFMGGLPPSSRLWAAARASGVADRVPCAAGQRWRWDGVEFAMIWPDGGPGPGASNAQSCVLRVSVGERAALLTGDLDAASERALVAQDRAALAAQVLIVPHHGSRTSSTEPFLDSVEPRVALFQVGYRNRFQHPHPTVWARYAGRGIDLPRTDRDGAVRIEVAANAATLAPQRYRDLHRRYWMD